MIFKEIFCHMYPLRTKPYKMITVRLNTLYAVTENHTICTEYGQEIYRPIMTHVRINFISIYV